MAYDKKSQAKYQKEGKRFFGINLAKNTCQDVIEKLESVDSISGYICQLIREDIKKEERG